MRKKVNAGNPKVIAHLQNEFGDIERCVIRDCGVVWPPAGVRFTVQEALETCASEVLEPGTYEVIGTRAGNTSHRIGVRRELN